MSEVDKLSDVGHLTPEVVAALVDGELTRGAEHRARIHLVHCVECRDEVREQRQASELLRGSIPLDQVRVSGSLLSRLVQIPDHCAAGDVAEPGHDAVGIDGCRRPDSITGRMAAVARKVQRRTSRSAKSGRGRAPSADPGSGG
ncbi:anti-sigma factor family protein [Corynebacterium kalidii]|uniref:Anti-sigma factor n=1 Tax=Corynebacterium kalidii TaxID=2931982 RepID=A0A9X1WMI1_9CORY|nr:anti-sigma factor [Corynebacterium kalidii]MCJ7859307.1 anti-sigma factor [Corynebacterium kalidii]